MSFVSYPDVRLRTPATLAANVDESLREIGTRLLSAAKDAKAYGLAAAHLGEVAPVVVLSGDNEGQKYVVLYNPNVRGTATETALDEEGSVSLPGIRVEIARPVWVDVAYLDEAGMPQKARFERFAARVALHEIEQMQGKFFLEHVSRLKREMLLKKARKLATG
ncbi:MAG: peptide deformylase [Devosia sp.]